MDLQIAVAGADARSLSRASGVRAAVFPTLRAAGGRMWLLLALAWDASHAGAEAPAAARNLLLAGDAAPTLACGTGARQVVCYGFSARDTLTLSSLAPGERMLCLQRSVRTLDGRIVEPQELPLPPALRPLSNEDALFAAGLRLLAGGIGAL